MWTPQIYPIRVNFIDGLCGVSGFTNFVHTHVAFDDQTNRVNDRNTGSVTIWNYRNRIREKK